MKWIIILKLLQISTISKASSELALSPGTLQTLKLQTDCIPSKTLTFPLILISIVSLAHLFFPFSFSLLFSPSPSFLPFQWLLRSTDSDFASKMKNRQMGVTSATNLTKSTSIGGDMCNLEKTDGSQSDTAVGLVGGDLKKRRSSIGAKMAAVVGMSRKSRSTSQLSQTGKTTNRVCVCICTCLRVCVFHLSFCLFWFSPSFPFDEPWDFSAWTLFTRQVFISAAFSALVKKS